jgi:membrane protein DedA with SNARE-associated domain/rhodanese-related sulfurtransferase
MSAFPSLFAALSATSTLDKFGYVGIFLWVFTEQLGVPIPSFPVLFAAGVVASQGHLDFLTCLVLASLAALVADSIWFQAGRLRGHGLLNFICRISWKPDSCISNTVAFFTRYGTKTLVFAKYIPGLNTLAPPLAGMAGVGWAAFLGYDLAGSILFAAVPLGLGLGARVGLGNSAAVLHLIGHYWVEILLALAVAFAVWRFYTRWRFKRFLRHELASAIQPHELDRLLAEHSEIAVIDVRDTLSLHHNPVVIPGARSIRYPELAKHMAEIPLDRPVVVYCDCPSDEAAALAARRLRHLGAKLARPLLGGLHAWQKANFQTAAWKPAS